MALDLYVPWSLATAKHNTDTGQLAHALAEAERRLEQLRGGMGWKTVGGYEYLVRFGRSGRHAKSFGPRTPETERLHSAFHGQKTALEARVAGLRERLREQARYNRAARLNRVPLVVSRVLRRLDRQGLLGRSLIVLGTNSLYAYEIMAGVFARQEVMETTDVDLLWDSRAVLRLAEVESKEDGDASPGLGVGDRLLRLVQKADASFQPQVRGDFRLINNQGFMIDLIRQERDDRTALREARSGQAWDREWRAAEIDTMKWFLNAPRMRETAVGEDGGPVPMVVTDPRAFAVFKHWLANQPERNPAKKPRDRAQARLVAELVQRFLPQYPWQPQALRCFPCKVVEAAFIDLTLTGSGTPEAGSLDDGFF